MTRERLISQLEKALAQNTALYNKLGRGEWSASKAGKVYDQIVGYKTIQAISLALIELKTEEEN